jgi:hypothetical protein
LSKHTAFIFNVISDATSLAITLTTHPELSIGISGDGTDSSRTVLVVSLLTITDPKVLYPPFISVSPESHKTNNYNKAITTKEITNALLYAFVR